MKPEPLKAPFAVDPTKLEELPDPPGWFTHPNVPGYWLQAGNELLDPSRKVAPDFVANEPYEIVPQGGRNLVRVYTRHVPAEAERLREVVAPTARTVEPQEFLDALIRYDELGLGRERGLPEIEDRLRTKGGLVIHLTPDSNGVMGSGEGGYWGHGAKPWAVDVLEALQPQFLVWKRDGVIPSCRATVHEKPVAMRTVIAGGVEWCKECKP